MNYYLILAFSFFSSLQSSPIQFVILITSFNNEKYVTRNLDYAMSQQSTVPYQVIYVNDQSTDNTAALVNDYKRTYDLPDSRLLVINNEERLGSGGGNIYRTVHTHIEDYKVVVCVDGDDYLAHTQVLKHLEKVYANPDVWMTYGSFVVIPEGIHWTICGGYPDDVIQQRSFRKHYNVPSHLKTFRAALYKRIKREDLINDETGTFYDKAWDMAMMFPLLEMCAPYDAESPNHSYYIDDILYMYNYDNPLSDYQDTGREEQMRLDRKIRRLKPYEPLDSLFEEEW